MSSDQKECKRVCNLFGGSAGYSSMCDAESCALSITEAETIAAVTCAQDMLYAREIALSLGLKAKLTIMLDVDNSGSGK